ncbi:Hypothetical predicted protein [Paramuricea clavata]|uniref:Uncharacterized protein n=1 Tax=Paramuricea clavata TaxID=317549 RepID=A0A7D9DKS9_PARCT|nr:Hypothetical predicted protein [Paramuricea clavata]
MPLLKRNWCEKSTPEERNRAELLCSSDCDSDPVILSMPLLSPTFYFQPADASDSDQVISMPLLSQRFYSKSTDCKKSTTHPECTNYNTDTLNTEVFGNLKTNENEQIFGDPQSTGHAVIKVAELLLTSGPMVPTQEAGKIYTKEKNLFLGLAEENLKKQK